MTFWHARAATHENDQALEQIYTEHTTRTRTMKKAASLATLWPRPASSPIAPTGIQDRSPFPPRISSLNRVPPPGWDSTPTKNGPNASASANSSARRPATAHVSSPAENRAEIAPGTVHASTGIKSVTSGSGSVGAQGSCLVAFCFCLFARRLLQFGVQLDGSVGPGGKRGERSAHFRLVCDAPGTRANVVPRASLLFRDA